MHRRRAWLVAVPLALAGCLGGHVLAYRLIELDAHDRGVLLAASGHDYFSHLPLVLLAAGTLVLAGALRHVAAVAAGREDATPPPWLFATLPPLAFVVQEYLERALSTGSFPLDAPLDPTFIVGLALQAPFALAAFAAAFVLLRAASALGLRFAPRPPRRHARPPRLRFPVAQSPRPTRLTVANAQRGPPATG